MRFFYTTGDDPDATLPTPLGQFLTFNAAVSQARTMLANETSGIIHLYLPIAQCNGGLPEKLLGWRARFRLVRVLSSIMPRRKGTPHIEPWIEEPIEISDLSESDTANGNPQLTDHPYSPRELLTP
jgi:hypothetical protein